MEEDLLREGVERMRGLAETTGAGVYRQLASVFGARLAARLVGQGRCEDALAVCDEALRDWPAQAGAMAARADALLELGRFDEARAEIERLKGAAPGYGAIEDLEAKWAARQR
ncbi:MAG: hypothetical protein BWZ10_00559 [candidate division BRC1 bacterium ADurb.BinA364]|nr:MAG: hypothetical protein BWZ10_00559 [candidate division BRC1 bacterium ADurb.BinA364]